MSNPILTTTYSKLDTRVKEPSSVGPPTLDRFKYFSAFGFYHDLLNFKSFS